MQPDSATRILLALILVCLVILIVQGFTARGDRPAAEAVGRYSVTGMRAGSPILVRTDSATGRVWKLELRAGAGDAWVEFREPGDGSAPTLDQPDQERPDPLGGDQALE